MNAKILVRIKPEVLDPQGDAVRKALVTLGFEGIKSVRIGKLIEIEMADSVDIHNRLSKMSDELLANPVMEDFEVQVEETCSSSRMKNTFLKFKNLFRKNKG